MGFDREIALRPVTLADTDLLFQWANDPETRQNSFSTQPILYEEHVKWMQTKLACSDTLFLIGLLPKDENCAFTDQDDFSVTRSSVSEIGLFRLDKKEDNLMISYSVAPAFRGRGLGLRLLRSGLLYEATKCVLSAGLAKPCFYAEVLPGNKASSKIFTKLGFVREVNTDGVLCYRQTPNHLLQVCLDSATSCVTK